MSGLENFVWTVETSTRPEYPFNMKMFKLGGEGGGVLGLACTPQPAAAESGQLNPEEQQ